MADTPEQRAARRNRIKKNLNKLKELNKESAKSAASKTKNDAKKASFKNPAYPHIKHSDPDKTTAGTLAGDAARGMGFKAVTPAERDIYKRMTGKKRKLPRPPRG